MLDSRIKNKLENIQYEIISQERPILSASNAKGYYPTEKSAPAFTLQAENRFVGYFTSFQDGRLDLVRLKKLFNFRKLKLADRERIKDMTGYDADTAPLVGLELPCPLDKKLLRHGFMFGGTGDELLTLEISPEGLPEVNEIIGMFE